MYSDQQPSVVQAPSYLVRVVIWRIHEPSASLVSIGIIDDTNPSVVVSVGKRDISNSESEWLLRLDINH